MKVARTIMIAGAAVFALAAQASAYTLNGTIPPHAPPKSVVLHPHIPVPYALTYCIGPAANPCGSPNDWTVEVPAGQTVVRTVRASLFTNKVFVVGQGTKKAVPYKVQIDPGL